jgi:hypothetical protein
MTEPEQWMAECTVDTALDGQTWPVTVRIGSPTSRPTGDWTCRVAIQGEPFEFDSAIAGVDSFQALVLAMGFIANSVEGMAEARGITLTVHGEPARFRIPTWS